jgi:RNA-directed DNA polymerase
MNQSEDIRKTQRSFARKAQAEPEHRFQDLWHLVSREDWMWEALNAVLANRGARTPGTDGLSKEDLKTESQKAEFIQCLREQLRSGTYLPTPVRRIWIPKPGKQEKRPLGIPTIKDRVVQELLRMLMEPIWESDFLDCSHGFRPGHRTMDCIRECYSRIQPQTKYYWIIEGDIRKCFDRINHQKLMELVQQRIADRRVLQLIDNFLKAGIMEDGLFQETPEGTPQGGILSPLLANIYLHELDRWWWENYGSLTPRQKASRRQTKKGNCILSRYADDFILLCNGPKAEAERLKQELRDYLWDELHLELSEEKTHITHATDGFDFLGFHIQREEPADNKPWLRVIPARKSEQRLKDTIRKMTSRATGWEPVPEKIRAINRVLRGWGNYYKQVSSSASRKELDWWVSQRMLKWLCSRHKGLGKRVVLKKYLIRQGKRKNWGAGEGREKVYLFMLRDITHGEYRRKKLGNPYLQDGNELISQTSMETPLLETWDGTTSRSKAEWWETRAKVLQRDGNHCVQCGSTEELEVHHLKPTGGNDVDNLLTLCQTCHANTPTYGVNRSLSHQG